MLFKEYLLLFTDEKLNIKISLNQVENATKMGHFLFNRLLNTQMSENQSQ